MHWLRLITCLKGFSYDYALFVKQLQSVIQMVSLKEKIHLGDSSDCSPYNLERLRLCDTRLVLPKWCNGRCRYSLSS